MNLKDLIQVFLDIFAPKAQEKLPKGIVLPSDEALKPYLEEQQADKEAKDSENEFKPIEAKDNSQRILDELKLLKTRNLPLASLLEDLNIFTNREFDKNIVITMIFRTQEEQDYLYKGNKKYEKKKFSSPHQHWQSADLRSRTFTPEEVEKIENYLNDKWNGTNYWKWTAKNHEVSHGIHFHIQFYKTK